MCSYADLDVNGCQQATGTACDKGKDARVKCINNYLNGDDCKAMHADKAREKTKLCCSAANKQYCK